MGQLEPVFGDVRTNIIQSTNAVRSAHAQGANIVVLPELISSGYKFGDREELEAVSETAGEGPATRAWQELADELGLVIVAGFSERADAEFYNSAYMAVPGSDPLVYRKTHLWDEEKLYFQPGNTGFPVVETEWGRLGMLICYDGWFPESYRSLAAQSVDIVCVPTNWVPIPGQRDAAPAMATTLTMAAAHINGVAIAAADRVGVERGQQFIGQSIICAATGWPVAGPADATTVAMLFADVNLEEIRSGRSWGAFNNPSQDRRPDQYLGM
ncbi:nitrilase-related carbon-nitrogen hydrolase [Brevibacterium aurantiacum]|uniref:nitrilase-related carbon-nitrogen hydrolase n=1 Tax=Brevibacterium aurantiacum TaxID=273384 RepID=UPI001F0B4632|nr:nitrilase-related carbon-nitrogen hydrolase [Brevibacterium aurantiacum]